MEIKRILFPTDFSEPSHHALPHALRIAQKYEAELTVLHVRTVHSDDPNRPEYRFLDRGRYEEYIKNSLSQLSDTVAPQHKVTTAVSREFSPASGILEFIRDNSVDVTVMGTPGRSALTHFFLGSVAEQVVRSARSPVLTVAHKGENYASNPDFQNILIAFDFSEHSREATHHVCAMADRYGAHLQAIYVIEQEVPPAYYGIWKNTLNQQLPEITAETREALGEALGGGRSFDSRDVHVKSRRREGLP